MNLTMYNHNVVKNSYLSAYNNKVSKLVEDYKQRNIILAESMFQVCNNEFIKTNKLDQFNKYNKLVTELTNDISTISVTNDDELTAFFENDRFSDIVEPERIQFIDTKLFEIDEFELQRHFTDSYRTYLVRCDEKFNDTKPVIVILQEMVRDCLGLKLLVVYHTRGQSPMTSTFKMTLSDYDAIVEGEDTCNAPHICSAPFARAVMQL